VLAVVVDVLRATTTLVHAFAHGARSARACATIEEARELAGERTARIQRGVLLCGERGGLRPEGFDRGNSPSELSVDVAGRDLVLSTTNGAPALARTAWAAHQFIAAFVNVTVAAEALGAIARRNASAPRAVWLIAAGKHGEPAAEDDALIGALAARLLARGSSEFVLEGFDPRSACEAAGFNLSSGLVRADGDLLGFLRSCEHGRALIEMGFERDLRDAAQVDAFTRLPFGRGGTIGPGLDRAQAPDIPLF
jgi:2-phosphosulfolactate phosphatase